LKAYRCDLRNQCLFEPPTELGQARQRKARRRNENSRDSLPGTS
jgi:hypothetical protein